MEVWPLMIQVIEYDPKVFDGLNVISNYYWYPDDPKEFDDLQVFNYSKRYAIESKNFDNPKIYGDSSVSNNLIFSSTKYIVMD